MILSDYMIEAVGDTTTVINSVINGLAKSGWDFNAVAFRGMSGALIAPAVGVLMGKNIILVRKPKNSHDDTHSNKTVEGKFDRFTRYVIIDDFMSSGKTVFEIVNAINNVHYKACYSVQLVGMVFYTRNCFSPRKDYYSSFADVPVLFTEKDCNEAGQREVQRTKQLFEGKNV